MTSVEALKNKKSTVIKSSLGDEVPILPITQPYLLVIEIPVYCDQMGRRWVDALWHKDLMLHLDYLLDFTLACPRLDTDPPAGSVEITDARIHFLDLPAQKRQSTKLLQTAWLLWRGVGRAQIVHYWIGSWWPLAMNYLVGFFAYIRGRFSIVIVESSTWRLLPQTKADLWGRVKAFAAERLSRIFVNAVDFSVFTQNEYKSSLLTRRPERGHVIHASWIDEQNLRSLTDFHVDWEKKGINLGQPFKVLFAGRLTLAKGVDLLLEAFHAASEEGYELHLDIIGGGELMDACRLACQANHAKSRLRLLDSVPYGVKFFSLLREYHAVVVPSVSDEQPRIVYDAYSQGVPVLVSNTPGLRDCVESGVSGYIFVANQVLALKQALQWAAVNKPVLRTMGETALCYAANRTHKKMHAQRHRLLSQALQKREQARADS